MYNCKNERYFKFIFFSQMLTSILKLKKSFTDLLTNIYKFGF